MRGAIAVVAVTAGAVIAALAIGLALPRLHTTGGNNLPPQVFVATLPPGASVCQDTELVPARSGSLDLSVGTYGRPGPALEVSVGDASSGRRAGGYGDGWVRVPFSGPAANRPAAELVDEVCVRNAGDARVAIAGKLTHPEESARVEGGDPGGGLMTLRWRAASEATWWSERTEVAERTARGKADFGPWTPLALVAVLWVGAFALVLRSARG